MKTRVIIFGTCTSILNLFYAIKIAKMIYTYILTLGNVMWLHKINERCIIHNLHALAVFNNNFETLMTCAGVKMYNDYLQVDNLSWLF